MQRRFHEDFPITTLLLLLVLGLYGLEIVAQWKLAEPGDDISLAVISIRALEHLGGLIPFKVVEEGQVWRLISCIFLHGGLIHLAFNAWVLFDLGRFCEPLLSSGKLFVVFVLCGLGGSAATWARGHLLAGGAVISIGASGALCGLIGILLVYSIRERHHELRNSLLRWLIYIVVLSLLPGIDWSAHAGGFAA
ncbi:MAG: rhomboid family intramembrane serine protease, partial [Planctomycetes bacterium]|nr:rhomboid family intramembrane serine protease [Planctomycetota bacterium]